VKTKIIPIRDEFFPENKKQRPLSRPMIMALVAAYTKQKNGISFGPSDVRRSFIPLVKRGLIVRSDKHFIDKKISWKITAQAITMLKNIGIETSH
jgi:hypothetical protein